MAEIIGVIGSVVGLLTAAEVAHSKMKGMKGLPEAFDAVARQVPLAQRILDAVESQTRNAPESTLRAILPVVHSCRENAETLKTTLEKLQPGDSASAWSLDHYVSLIKCRGKKGRVEDLMRQILRDILTLASYKTIHAATSEELAGLKAAIEEVGNVKASAPDTLLEDAKGVNISHGGQGPMLNQVGDYTTSWNHFGSGHINHVQGDAHFGATQDERKRQALRRLNASSYESHKDRNPPAAVNTCRWFVEHQNFRDWLSEQSSSLLWVSADPGCGKSVLARHLIENVLPTSTPSSRVIYFFFKDDFADQRSAESALRGLLHQLLSGDSPLFTKALLESFEDLGEKMFEGFSNLWRLFLNTISQPNAGEIICVLGALDECHVGWDRLIKSLGELCGNPTSGFKPILLSRPYSNIESDFRSLQGKVKFIRVRGEDDSELTNIESEIEIVIRSKVDGLKKELGLTQEAEELLFQQLCQTQNRTYLWVHLVCDMLRTVENVSISDSIQQIPKTVEEAYNKILNQGRDHDKARVLLHIVVAAYKPLSLDEMATALAIQSHKSLEMPELQVATAEDCRKIIRNVCGLFVVIKDTKVYLIHQTAREFLIGCNDIVHGLPSLEWKSCLQPHDSNGILARICIRYLNWVGNFHPLLGDPELKAVRAYSRKHTLFDYTARYWAYHYKDSNLEADSEMISCLSRLCKTSWTGFRAWYELFCEEPRGYSYRFGKPPKINLDRYKRGDDLNLASYFGITQACERVLETGASRINARYKPERRTALSWAAGAGHLDVVQLFLKKRTFIEHITSPRVDIRRAGDRGNTTLHLAARQGHDAVVRALLATSRAGVNMRNDGKDTALLIAAENGHTAVVQALLDDGRADVDPRNSDGATPLHLGASLGHLAVVQILLATEKVDVDSETFHNSQTPLSCAAEGGHVAVVWALLATGKVDVASKDDDNLTPLHHAASSGCNEVVQTLLATGKVDVDSQDTCHYTALGEAASQGRLGTVKILVNTGKANVNSPIGETSPLALAIRRRHLPIVKYLHGERNASIDPSRRYGSIFNAVLCGNLESFQYLCDAEQLDVNTLVDADRAFYWENGENLLITAIRLENYDICKDILARNADVNIVDSQGRTPLTTAIQRAPEYVELLLNTRKADLTLKTSTGLTPRLLAYERDFLSDEGKAKINYALSMADKGKALGQLERIIVESTGLEHLGITNFFDA